jgi:putative hydrolase of the HAD superfamily
MTIRAVIFDAGGVLLRTRDTERHRRWETRFGLPSGRLWHVFNWSDLAARATIGLISAAELWQQQCAHLGLDAEERKQLQEDFWAGEFVDTELVQFIRSLRPQYKTALLSNAWSDAREAFCQKYRLDEIMDTIIVSAEESLAKPDPRIFLLTAERLGVRPDECVFVDDVLQNVEGARAVGMKGVQFVSTEQCIADVKSLLVGSLGSWL